MCNAHEVQRKALDALDLDLTNGCNPPCGSWGPKLSLLQEQQVLVAAQSPLQVSGHLLSDQVTGASYLVLSTSGVCPGTWKNSGLSRWGKPIVF